MIHHEKYQLPLIGPNGKCFSKYGQCDCKYGFYGVNCDQGKSVFCDLAKIPTSIHFIQKIL